MSNIEQKYYTIVSNKGKQAVIKALANKELIDLTTMSVGDGESPIDTNWQSLPNEKDKFGITQIKIIDNITLEVTGILSASKGGYMIRQAGLYTSDNILFAIAQLPQTAKPVLSDGASKDMTIKFVITIADTSVVNLSIDPNINIITQSRLDEVIELNANELRVEIEDKVDALKKETTTNLATKADKSVTYTKTEVDTKVNAKANANATVNLTGNQTVAGIKTFSSPPVSATQPTANNQVANKAYVDSKIGKAYITETYTNGASWYRVWSNGFCEQGSTLTTKSKNYIDINFLKAFGNTNYTLNISKCFGYDTWTGGDYVFSYTASSFRYFLYSSAQVTIFWTARGYI